MWPSTTGPCIRNAEIHIASESDKWKRIEGEFNAGSCTYVRTSTGNMDKESAQIRARILTKVATEKKTGDKNYNSDNTNDSNEPCKRWCPAVKKCQGPRTITFSSYARFRCMHIHVHINMNGPIITAASGGCVFVSRSDTTVKFMDPILF